ncbi:hypothetical protein HDU97_002313 [Phlyctochytrium planicorne]|nr:hypothetical protein HDU97_002313 [Phlyctochytrium planicorne]
MFSFSDPQASASKEQTRPAQQDQQGGSAGLWGFLKKVRGTTPVPSSPAATPEPPDEASDTKTLPEDPISNLKKIRRLRASGGITKEYWMSDSQVKECYECSLPFTAFKRKHHCRICGQIFCHKCASSTVPGDRFGYLGDMRICNYCMKLIDSYQNDDVPRPLPQRSLSSDQSGAKNAETNDKKESEAALTPVKEEPKKISENSNSPFRSGVDDDKSFMDMDSSEYLTEDEPEATLSLSPLGQDERNFQMNKGRDIGIAALKRPPRHGTERASRRRNVKVGHPRPSKYSARAVNRQISRNMSNIKEYGANILSEPLLDRKNDPQKAGDAGLDVVALNHLKVMLQQLLEVFELDEYQNWDEVILDLVIRAASSICLDVKNNDEMDIGHYIKIKKIPGGVPSDSDYIAGIVCSKNVAHKRMLRPLTKPRILLLKFPIEYQRVDNVFMSLEPVLAQEREHVKNLTSRIVALDPSIVIVEKTVSRIALEFFLEAGITIVHTVKPSIIEAIARCTGAEIIASMDRLAIQPKLGSCERFEVRYFDNRLIDGGRKTFLYFQGCQKELGCTLILRGGSSFVLNKVKQIVNMLTFVAYNLRLETFLLRDELAMVTNEPTKSEDIYPTSADSELSVSRALYLYQNTRLSASSRVKFPPPYLLSRLAELNTTDIRKKKDGDDDSQKPDIEIPPKEQSLDEEGGAEVFMTSQNLTSPADALLDGKAGLARLIKNAEELSPFNHQNIMFLFSSICTETLMPCDAPDSHSIEYYKETDMTLGQYLENLCYNTSLMCQAKNCNTPMLKHFRSYAHGQGRVNVVIEEFDSPESSILMWSYCKICKARTPSVPMSEETWKYSFGKYLELIFYHAEARSMAIQCPHDIHRQHVRFFALKNFAVRFEYETIDLLEISVPSNRIRANEEHQLRLKNQDFEYIRYSSNITSFILTLFRNVIVRFYESVLERVKSFSYDIIPSQKAAHFKEQMAEFAKRASAEMKFLLQLLQHTMVVSPPSDILALNNVLKALHEKVPAWDVEYSALLRAFLPIEPQDLRKFTAMQIRKMFTEKDNQITAPSNANANPIAISHSPHALESIDVSPSLPTASSLLLHPDKPLDLSEKPSEGDADSFNLRPNRFEIEDDVFGFENNLELARQHLGPASPTSTEATEIFGPEILPASAAELLQFSSPTSPYIQTETDEAIHELSDAMIQSSALVPVTAHIAISSPLKDATDHPLSEDPPSPTCSPTELVLSTSRTKTPTIEEHLIPDGKDSMTSTTSASAENQVVRQRRVEKEVDYHNVSEWHDVSGVSTSDAERVIGVDLFKNADNLSGAAGERGSIMKTLSSLWNGTTVTLPPLDYPMTSADHFFSDSPIIVREDEPSSIIALMLRSNYRPFTQQKESMALMKLYLMWKKEHKEIWKKRCYGLGIMLNFVGLHNLCCLLNGSEFVQGQTKIDCKTYYAEQFDALRRNCGFQDQYVQSLSRCVKWEASGGKSRSIFLKSRDDRLILKQLSRQEMDALLKFALNYFTYVSESFFHNIFDLKGSMRNRHIQSTGRENEVLLDENLVEYICESPLFIREHSKILLRASVYNDTLFLARLNVMDYSLLVGIDEEKRELVVGIVDFIRTFTWDKKLESWVKENAFLGGGREPTILSPRQYKSRFRESMERYFLCPPTKFHTIG